MFVTKPPFPADIYNLSTFPSYENTYFEFKRNLQTYDSLTKAICGMLNRKGGYIIFGVDDETHRICGVIQDPKFIDDFSQYIDKITGNRLIITMDNKPLDPDNIVIQYVPHRVGLLVVLHITPIKEVQYKMIDGSIYVRLNSSTWNFSRDEQLYRKWEIDRIIASKLSNLTKIHSIAEKRIMNLHWNCQVLDEEKASLQRHLFDKILREKEAAEKELACAKRSGLCYWFCLI